MGRRPKWGRAVSGVLVLNKHQGLTSNAALQQAKRLFYAKRAGHTGSLDPLATGVLPICFGESTKFSQYLLDANKRYLSTFRLGIETDTGDCDGNVVAERSASHITRKMVESVLPKYRGVIWQTPSIYSALKYQGKPLYKWAREGISLPREARQARKVTVFDYDLTAFRTRESAWPEMDVLVSCSKGTYIRSLAEDIGQDLGCGAHVVRLHRQMAGPFTDDFAISLHELSDERGERSADILDHHLLPVDAPIASLPNVSITANMAAYFCQGQSVMSTEVYRTAKEGGMVRIYSEREFLGVAELFEGSLVPKRLVNRPLMENV